LEGKVREGKPKLFSADDIDIIINFAGIKKKEDSDKWLKKKMMFSLK
jgi:hypothetical protein